MAMLRVLIPLVLVLGVAAGASAQTATAATTPPASPYSTTVPVAGTSDTQRNAAIAEALGQVLQQVAPGLTAAPDVLAQAPGYVRDYHYRRAASGGLELQVDFDSGAVGRLVAQAQNAAAGTLAGQPGTAASAGAVAQGGAAILWVDGIDDSHAFAALLSTLRGDQALHDVIPEAAEGDGVLLQVSSDRALADVLAGLAGPTGHLAPAAQPHPGADASLHWTP
jgi:hypothetical protein